MPVAQIGPLMPLGRGRRAKVEDAVEGLARNKRGVVCVSMSWRPMLVVRSPILAWRRSRFWSLQKDYQKRLSATARSTVERYISHNEIDDQRAWQEVVAHAPVSPTPAYLFRGLDMPTAAKQAAYLDYFEAGRLYDTRGVITSYSYDLPSAMLFTRPPLDVFGRPARRNWGVLMVVYVPGGTPMFWPIRPRTVNENELVLPGDMVLRYIGQLSGIRFLSDARIEEDKIIEHPMAEAIAERRLAGPKHSALSILYFHLVRPPKRWQVSFPLPAEPLPPHPEIAREEEGRIARPSRIRSLSWPKKTATKRPNFRRHHRVSPAPDNIGPRAPGISTNPRAAYRDPYIEPTNPWGSAPKSALTQVGLGRKVARVDVSS